jgi:hypothetical protein
MDVGNDEKLVNKVVRLFSASFCSKHSVFIIGAVNGPKSVIPACRVGGCEVLVDLLDAAARSWT